MGKQSVSRANQMKHATGLGGLSQATRHMPTPAHLTYLPTFGRIPARANHARHQLCLVRVAQFPEQTGSRLDQRGGPHLNDVHVQVVPTRRKPNQPGAQEQAGNVSSSSQRKVRS